MEPFAYSEESLWVTKDRDTGVIKFHHGVREPDFDEAQNAFIGVADKHVELEDQDAMAVLKIFGISDIEDGEILGPFQLAISGPREGTVILNEEEDGKN